MRNEDLPMQRLIVYFLCTGNSCRSQMAEGWTRHLASERIEVRSAGLEVHGLNPRAVASMREVGIDIASQQSKLIDTELLNRADYVITLCGDANDRCPITPNTVTRLHWGFEDPARIAGTESEVRVGFNRVRDGIGARVQQFLEEIDRG